MDKLCKEFLLYKIAKLDNGNKFDKNKMTHDNPCYNFVSRTAANNGISDFVDDNGTKPYPAGTITLAFGGSIGSTFVQPKPYYTGQNVGVITLPDNVSEEAKVYFAISLEKMCKCKYVAFADEINKHFKKDLTVVLPVIENSNPDHEYTVDDIDWQYMRDRITELERDRITELDAYLQATGLNDYELTEDDKKILSLSAKRASDENGTLEDNSEDEMRFGKFVMHDIFEPLTVKKAVKANVRNYQDNEFCVPVVYAKFGDNGIMYWGRKNEFTTYSNVLSIVYNGVIAAGKCYAQEEETGILAESYLIRYKNGEVPFLANLYMSKVIEHKIYPLYSRENLAIWNNRVENEVIELPIKSDGTPDFDYMERYIRAMEKVVIADVVKYKDKVIETTKKVVGE